MSDHHEEEQDIGDYLSPHNVVDKVILGRRIRALRILHGFDRVTDLVGILRSQYGIDISDRTVYAIERGEQMPHIDFMVAIASICEAPTDYFRPAYRSDLQEKFDARFPK